MLQEFLSGSVGSGIDVGVDGAEKWRWRPKREKGSMIAAID
jgi:hypothetical protein